MFPDLKNDWGGYIPSNVPSFIYASTIYEIQRDNKKALELCDEAIKYGIKDNYPASLSERRERLLKKLESI